MVEIVAELAQGFEGRPEQAKLLLLAAAKAGADIAKFQLVYADELATQDYQYYDLFKSLEMDDDVWFSLSEYAAELNIELALDIFGVRSLLLAEKLKLRTVKLHGTDTSNVGFLEQIAASNIPKIHLGVGGAFASEIEKALDILSAKKVVLFLGFQGYPTPTNTNQIARVKLVADQFLSSDVNVQVGYADHAQPDNPLAISLAAMAIGAGATILEKHLTLGKVMLLEDYESALNPDEFAQFSSTIRECQSAFGDYQVADDFGMSDVEKSYRQTIRRHVVTSQDLPQYTVLSPADVVLKRSSTGNFIENIESVYGKTLNKTVRRDTALTSNDIE